MNNFKLIVFSMFLTGCTSSYHNLNTDGTNALGGGFTDYKVSDGLYSIISKTNFAPWTNFSGAYKSFNRRATELCGTTSFKPIKIHKSQYEHIQAIGAVQYIISQINGYVICNPAKLTEKEAEKLIQANHL